MCALYDMNHSSSNMHRRSIIEDKIEEDIEYTSLSSIPRCLFLDDVS